MSEISSSPRTNAGGDPACCDGVFAVGATAADAPPAIAKDIPAAPHAGKALFRRFRFEACLARAICRALRYLLTNPRGGNCTPRPEQYARPMQASSRSLFQHVRPEQPAR